MTEPGQTYLPPGAITGERVRAALADALEAWGQAYFETTTFTLFLREDNHTQQSCAMANRPSVPGKVSVLLSALGQRRALEAALKADLEAVTTSAADRTILNTLADQMRSELVGRIEKVLGSGTGGGTITLEFAINGRTLGTLSLPRQPLLSLLRKAMPRNQASPPAFPKSRLAAADGARLLVEGVLGQARLPIADARGIAIGDVIVLDCNLVDKALLRLAPHGRVIAGGTAAAQLGHNAITITDRPAKEHV